MSGNSSLDVVSCKQATHWIVTSYTHQRVRWLFLGWDKNSYGYHGDDGHSFCSSGTGQPYGPTFTTGDVIGCGVNLVDNTCFYTKNGHHLGIAFRGLPVSSKKKKERHLVARIFFTIQNRPVALFINHFVI